MKKITHQDFIDRSVITHNNKFNYSLVKFKNNDSIIEIICPTHGIFNQRLSSHLDGNGCKRCQIDNRRTKIDDFILKSNIIHNSKYDYSLIEYKTVNTKVKIICNIHGVFLKSPKSHLIGEGCKECNKIFRKLKSDEKVENILLQKVQKSKINNSIKLEKFIFLSDKKHNNKYDYSKVIYKTDKSKVIINCYLHGEFYQSPHCHILGKGCRRCYIESKNDKFILKSNRIHNNKYDYSNSKYIGGMNKVDIICPIHGKFSQIASDHMRGIGCISCGSEISVSKLEIIWINYLNIPIKYRQYKIGKYIVDGYDPITNTIYEFNGDFWHGNPKKYNPEDINPLTNYKFGRLYINTLNKEKCLVKKGYRVISIWESDFKNLLKFNS